MVKFNVTNRLILTSSIILIILVLNIASLFILISKKNIMEDALNISQQTRKQLLKAEKVNESLLQVENSFHEYYNSFDPQVFNIYKKQINELSENIEVLIQAVQIDTVRNSKDIRKLLVDKKKESEMYLNLRAITDSLIFSVNVLDERKEELSKIHRGSLNMRIDTISVTETTTDRKKGLIGKIKSAIVGEEVEQSTNSKISISGFDEANMLEEEIFSYPNSYKTLSSAGNLSESNNLAAKTLELRNSGLRLIRINKNLISEISELTHEIELGIKDQEVNGFDTFINSVKTSARSLQVISIVLVVFALILSIYLVLLALENDKSQKRIIELNRRVNHQSVQKDKFLSIISHDLLNPFNALLGFSEILKDVVVSGDKEEIVEYSSIIHETTVRILALLQNLLIWARTQNGKIKYSPTLASIDELVQGVVLVLTPVAAKKNIDLEYNVEKITSNIDVNMISSVLQNLVTNAIKFTNASGRVTIRAWNESNNLNFVVSDTGVGMSKEQLDKLFRIEATRSGLGTENETGTGLGLSIVKEFVELHGGKIWVESTLGKGSKFYFSIPQNGGN